LVDVEDGSDLLMEGYVKMGEILKIFFEDLGLDIK
jgi:hypothetical protein